MNPLNLTREEAECLLRLCIQNANLLRPQSSSWAASVLLDGLERKIRAAMRGTRGGK